MTPLLPVARALEDSARLFIGEITQWAVTGDARARESACLRLRRHVALLGFLPSRRVQEIGSELLRVIGSTACRGSCEPRVLRQVSLASVRWQRCLQALPDECAEAWFPPGLINDLRRVRGQSALPLPEAGRHSPPLAHARLRMMLHDRLRGMLFCSGNGATQGGPRNLSRPGESLLHVVHFLPSAFSWCLRAADAGAMSLSAVSQLADQCLLDEALQGDACPEGADGLSRSANASTGILARTRVMTLLQRRVSTLLLLREAAPSAFVPGVLALFSQMVLTRPLWQGVASSPHLGRVLLLGEHLALHLQRWPQGRATGETLLVLCLMHAASLGDVQSAECPQRLRGSVVMARVVRQLERRVRRAIVAHQRTLSSQMRVTRSDPDEVAGQGDEVPEYGRWLLTLAADVPDGQLPQPQDALLRTLEDLCSACLCRGAIALHTCCDRVRGLVLLAIERRVRLTAPWWTAMRSLCDTLISPSWQQARYCALTRLESDLRAARREVLAGVPRWHVVLRGTALAPSHSASGSAAPDSASEALPVYLATHLSTLVIAPEAMAESTGSAMESHRLSRRCLLELQLLARGAAALQVSRVAQLSEVLAQMHRCLLAEADAPDQLTRELLGEAHATLRRCLNQAAARQWVEDVHPLVAKLYTWLETGRGSDGTGEAARWRSQHERLIQALAAGLVSLDDALRVVPEKSPSLLVAREILSVQQRTLAAVQEELNNTDSISLQRWHAPLMQAAARAAAEQGRQVRLQVNCDTLRVTRSLALALAPCLERLLEVVIAHGLPRAGPEPDREQPLPLVLRARQKGSALRFTLRGLSALTALPSDERFSGMLAAIDGKICLRSQTADVALSLPLPLARPRWDIDPKPL